ncbi:uncharacterized protein LOC129237087 [Anastrepha obliqua]|uniref:uncharacterized protein LOC129237087 n=1 Tax=Anastrepha obliqua TaxID=95512 RepID=UPI00240933C3|nr:uncharacterized protein LOC129237087 [Anastrepha obliqua]
MATPRASTRNATTMPSGLTATQKTQPRTQQLTTLTVLMLTMLTVLTQMPARSTAASLHATKESAFAAAAPAAPVLNTAGADNALSNSQPAVLQQMYDSTANGQRGRRKRLHKRHNASIRLSELAGASEAEITREWHNSCGGQEVMPRSERPMHAGNHKYVRKQLVALTKSLRYENTTLNTLHKINIEDMPAWRLHSNKYKFLPSLNRNSKVELRRWHRDMQTYVASFIELGVKQYRWDQEKRQHTSAEAYEINSLVLSSKRELCELETAFNATHPKGKLQFITGEEMQKKLKFYSRDEKRVAERGADPIDLRYAKQRYTKYIRHMFHILRHQLRTRRAAARASSKSMAYSYENNSQQWAALAQAIDYSAGSEQSAQGADEANSNESSLGLAL